MKTSFVSFSLLLAAAFPLLILVEMVGVPVSAMIEIGAFSLFVAIHAILLLVGDYARPTASLPAALAVPASPLAKEERRLAA